MAVALDQVVLEDRKEKEPAPPGGIVHWLFRSRGGHGVLLGALSGVLATLALEDFHIWPLAFIAFVPAIVAQHRIMPARWQALPLAIAVGMMFQGYLGPGLSAAASSGSLDWYMQIFGIWVVWLVYGLARRSRPFHIRTNYRFFILATPAAWVAIDALRGYGADFLGGTWGNIAYSLYNVPEVLQPISITGIHGVNFLILVINWTIAKQVLVYLDRTRGPVDGREPLRAAPARRDGIIVGTIVLVWVASSLAMLDTSDTTVRVGTVQPADSSRSADGTYTRISSAELLERQITQTRDAVARGAQIVSWHEGGFRGDLLHTDVGDQFADLARELGIYLNVGWGAPIPDVAGRYNEVAAFSPDGEFLGTNGKSHIGDFAEDAGDKRRKHQYSVYPTFFGAYGTIICFDLDFTNSARKVAGNGANVLAVSSSDPEGIQQKHSTHMVFRAIETGMGVFKADSRHDSIVVDPWGRILDYFVTMDGAQATLVVDLPYRDVNAPDTFYVRFGEWFGWLNALFVVFLLGLSFRLRRSDRLAAATTGLDDLRVGTRDKSA